MNPRLIMVRENIQAGATFFRITPYNMLEYSFDKTIWHQAGYLPKHTPEKQGGGGNVIITDNSQVTYFIAKYTQNYYQTTNFVNIINNFPPPQGAVDFVDEMEGIQNTAYNDLKLCQAITALFTLAREAGKGIRNGAVEVDDINGMWDFMAGASGVIAGGGLVASGVGAVGAGVAGSAVTVAIDQNEPGWTNYAQANQWSDGDMNDYICCAYQALKGGTFNYTTFENLGNTCGIGAWDEICTPELYAGFITAVKHGTWGDECACETCLFLSPLSGEITNGAVKENSLVLVDTIITGNVREMIAGVKFTFAPMTISSVKVCTIEKHYENTTANNPLISFQAPNTGGGNVQIGAGMQITLIPSNLYPLVPVTECTITFRGALCSACTTTQLASYNDTFGSIVWVEICGVQ